MDVYTCGYVGMRVWYDTSGEVVLLVVGVKEQRHSIHKIQHDVSALHVARANFVLRSKESVCLVVSEGKELLYEAR